MRSLPSGKRRKLSWVGPGLIYGLIRRRAAEEKEEEEKKKEDSMLSFYKKAYASAKGKIKGKVPENVVEALEFLGWDIPPEAVLAGAKTGAVYLGVTGLVLTLALLYVMYPDVLFLWESEYPLETLSYYLSDPFFWFTLSLPLLLAFMGQYFFLNYPVLAAEETVKRELVHIPRIVGYMVMSMKLVPNLEKAMQFAADHGEGKLAEELKKALWYVHIGMYESAERALDALAYKWGKYLEEFKHALMRIRSSVLEGEDAKRFVLLDNALTEVVSGIKERLLDIAGKLYMPAMQLFYLGVFLPLLLFIVLPVGAAFSGADFGKAYILVPLYNIGLPLAVFFFARSIIAKRPPVYVNPQIEEEVDEIRRKKAIQTALIVFLLGVVLSYVLHIQFDWTSERIDEYICGSPRCTEDNPQLRDLVQYFDQTPYMLFNGVLLSVLLAFLVHQATLYPNRRKAVGLALLVALAMIGVGYALHTFLDWTEERIAMEACGSPRCLEMLPLTHRIYILGQYDQTQYWMIYGVIAALAFSLATYFHVVSKPKYKRQKEVMEIESGFKDAIYVLASRMGEGKPLESALEAVGEFMPKSPVAKLFQRISYNVNTMGLPLHDAVFDPVFGALKDIPSQMLRHAFKLVVDAVQLGTELASKALIAFSEQLRNEAMVVRAIKSKMSEIATMMNAMALMVAPIVLGITVALEQVIVASMAGMSGTETNLPPEVAQQIGFTVQTTNIKEKVATPGEYLYIVSVYTLEIVILLVFFATYLLEGPDEIRFMRNVARTLPVAVMLFIAASWGALSLVGGVL